MSFQDLFNRWKTKYKFEAFISDGIVDENCYENPHILFVLRDMNSEKENNLCNELRKNGSGWPTWNNVTRWVYALLDGNINYPSRISREDRVKQLKRIAVMNLKKEHGGAHVDGEELKKSVKDHKDFILEEVELCDPEIIVCCGLSSTGVIGNAVLMKEYVFSNTTEWRYLDSVKLNRLWRYYYAETRKKKIPVVEFCHPQATAISGKRGHELFEALYYDMLNIKEMLL